MRSRIERPDGSDGAGWLVYDHLADLVVGDSDTPELPLNPDQSGLIAFYDLRTQVNSDGFEGYFRHDYGDDAPTAVRMAAALAVPDWHPLLAAAVALFGEPYPGDRDDRAERVGELAEAGTFDAYDERFYQLEADHQLDAAVDRHVWDRPGSYFAAAHPRAGGGGTFAAAHRRASSSGTR